jgi:hypothetical protein
MEKEKETLLIGKGIACLVTVLQFPVEDAQLQSKQMAGRF